MESANRPEGFGSVKKIQDALDALIAQKSAEAEPATPDFLAAEAENRRRDWLRANIPTRYEGATMAAWEPQSQVEAEAKAQILEWLELAIHGGSSSLVLYGAHGVGKTHIGYSVLAQTYGRCSARRVVAKAYTEAIRETYRDESTGLESRIREQHADCRILVLDELGRQFDTEAEKRYLFDLFDARYNAMNPTLILTNMGPEEFRSFVGSGIMDRLAEDGGKFIGLNWPSRRRS